MPPIIYMSPPPQKKKKKKKKKPTKEFDGGWLQSKETEQESMRGPFELNMTFIKGGGCVFQGSLPN